MEKYDSLKLSNQLCFPLYACAKDIVRKYTPYLNELNITYTQYITMMVMWENETITSKELGDILYLDSGTLTPLLKRLESKGYLTRERSETDERMLIVALTDKGAMLKDAAVKVPIKMQGCINLAPEEMHILYKLLYKILDSKGE